MRFRITHVLSRSPILSLAVMTACFLLFGYFSLNLFFLFKANIELVAEHGAMALAEGAAEQLFLIFASGFASSFFYTGIKLCENSILRWMTRPQSD